MRNKILQVIIALTLGLFVFFPYFVQSEESISLHYLNKSRSHVRAEFILPVPATKIWNLLISYDKHSEVFEEIQEVRVVKVMSGQKLTETKVNAGPFIVSYRSLVTENKGALTTKWRQTEGPFSVFEGEWKLVAIDTQTTTVYYTVHIEHPLMPDWLKSHLITSSIPKMHKSLQNYFE